MRIVRPLSVLAAAILSAVVVSSPLHSQQSNTGRVAGRVVDASSGQPVAGAQITVEGTGIAVLTDWQGRFMLPYVPTGSWTVSVRAIGYTHKSVTGVDVSVERATPLDVTLTTAVIEMAGVEVTAEVERGSVASALNEQRNARQIVSSVTAEQIAKSPDSDAGQAVQRVSGVTVQDGRYVFVRGLGERYTTTALNGARLPSAEPEKKVVPLDLFPSGLLEGITTFKTFTPDQPGDFSGAQVNLRTRDYLTQSFLKFSVSAGANTGATGTTLPHAPQFGAEWLGFAGEERQIPSALQEAGDLVGTTQPDHDGFINSMNHAWLPTESSGTPNGSMSVALGGLSGIAGQPLNYVGSFTYSYGQEARLGERRSFVRVADVAENKYRGTTGRMTVLWGGLLNLSTQLGSSGQLSLNNTFTKGADNEATRLAGFNEEVSLPLDISRLTFTERNIRSHQLAGQHLVAGRHNADWSLTTSSVHRSEPDRTDLVYVADYDSTTLTAEPTSWYNGSLGAVKTYSDIFEDTQEGSVNYQHRFGSNGRETLVKVGGYARHTDRDADTRSYGLGSTTLTDAERSRSPEQIFPVYSDSSRLFLTANAALGRYDANDQIYAGYVQFELPLSSTLRLLAGARVELADLEVNSVTHGLGTSTSQLRDTDILPAIALTWRLRPTHTLRLSATQTVSRPEYRELSPTTYFDIIGGQRLFGNADLQRSLIRNIDVRWEWYPGPAQVLSVALFGKQFHQPIERVAVQTSGGIPDATFDNTQSAENYGVELEIRHHLGVLAPALLPLTLFANVTVMRSDIRVGGDDSPFTNPNRSMVGQSNHVLNAGLSYASPSGRLTATVLYNVVGRRIFEAGIMPVEDAYEEGRELLDLSVHFGLLHNTSLKFDAKNLLDSPYRLTQGSVERLYYRSSQVFTLGVSWEH